MSSGDPLEDAQTEREKAVDDMLSRLSGGQGSLLLANAKPQESGDPLVDAQKAADEERDKLIESLADKGKNLIATDDETTGDALADTEAKQRAIRDELLKSLTDGGNQLAAEGKVDAEAAGEGLRADKAVGMAKFTAVERRAVEAAAPSDQLHQTGADDSARHLETDDADFKWPWSKSEGETGDAGFKWPWSKSESENDSHEHGGILEANGAAAANHGPKRASGKHLLAAGTNTHTSGAGRTDLTQMFGGAFILVAAIALFATVNRRRKQAKPVPQEEEGCDYQLYL